MVLSSHGSPFSARHATCHTTRPTAAPLRSFGGPHLRSLAPERMSANIAALPIPSPAFIAGGFAGGAALCFLAGGGGGGPFPLPLAPLPFPPFPLPSPFALGAGGGWLGLALTVSFGGGAAAACGACGCGVANGFGCGGACRFGTSRTWGRGFAMEARRARSAGATSQAGLSVSFVSPSVQTMCATWPKIWKDFWQIKGDLCCSRAWPEAQIFRGTFWLVLLQIHTVCGILTL